MKKYRCASFFCGVGGIDLGFEKTKKFKTVYANDIDSFAAKTYEENFDLKVDIADIRHVNEKSLPDFDVLLAGFPCQAFSIAGYRQGFDDLKGRGNLFFDLIRIIEEKKPSVIFLENVRNLVGHDKGNTFKVIVSLLEQNNYHVKHLVMNSKDYGNIPQNRERIYIVGFQNPIHFNRFEFPKKLLLSTKLSDVIDFKNKKDDIYYYHENNFKYFNTIKNEFTFDESVFQWRRVYLRKNKSGVCPTLTANMGTGGHNVPLIFTEHGIRKLTPKECFLLQGFPNNFLLPNISNSNLYKQAGNSVVVPVIERIAKEILFAISTK